MDIITGAAPLYHHAVGYDSLCRTAAAKFLVGHVEVDGSWEDFTLRRHADLRERPPRRLLEAGEIDTIENANGEDALEACLAALASVNVTTQAPNPFDTQMLVCRGAAFHDDLHGWDNALFLNWYLAGPPRDFVVAGIGRFTLRPGDVVLFDPSRPHALLQQDARRFSKTGWGKAPEDHSIFLSADVALTPELDVLFGIERAPAVLFQARGSVDIEHMRVLPATGTVRDPSVKRAA